ncbi:MAG: hypothetical protein J6V72_12830, partial [Kiritimatiellae bacterium]|nr:hypothetical protein [Kiritimatiellia bacterium]
MKKADEKKAEAKKDDKKSKDGDKKGKAEKADKKADGKKAASKKDDDEDKDAEAEKAQEEAEAKAEGKEVKKDAKESEKEEKKDSEKEEEKKEPEEEKKDDSSAEEPAAEEKPAENAVPAIALPPSVKNYEKLWADVCQYRAADIKYHGRVRKLLEMAKAADALTEQDESTVAKLAALANDLVQAYGSLKGEKWLIDAKRKLHGIDARARNFSGDAIKKIKLAVERHERALKEKREAEEKAAAVAAAAEKLKEKVAEEQQKALDEFEALSGDIKRIDWARCTRALTRLHDGMTTREGKEAVNNQLQKIKVMEGMQKHFIKHAKGFAFKNNRG